MPPPLLENLCERVALDSGIVGPKGTSSDALLDFDLEEEELDDLLEELDLPRPLLEELLDGGDLERWWRWDRLELDLEEELDLWW